MNSFIYKSTKKKQKANMLAKKALAMRRQSVNHYRGMFLLVLIAIHTVRKKRITRRTDKWKNCG